MARARASLLVAFASGFGLAACGDDHTGKGGGGNGGSATGGTGGGSAGLGTGGGPAGAGGAQACSPITNSGPTVNETRIAEAMPAMAGGTLVDGTYELTQWELYTGPAGATGATGATKKSTLTIAGGAWQVVELNSADAADTFTFTLTCAPSGTSVNCSITCPIAGSFSLPYTITTSSSGTELELIDTNSTPNHLGTWVKR